MSYDLAVWEGERPLTDLAAGETFEELYARYLEGPPNPKPTPAIARYVAALLERWPDIDGPGGEDSPWADAPMLNNSAGPIIYFAMSFSRCAEASEFAAQLAAKHGLVCFDPQDGTLR
jgi:hypothetical protein